MSKPPNGSRIRWLLGTLAAPPTVECVLWPFALGEKDYPRVQWEGRERYAHHVVLIVGGRSLPGPGEESRHTCGRGRGEGCVNPAHIVVGTHRENQADKRLHGRMNTGERNGQAKLSDAEVAEIRSATGLQREIALRFGTSPSNVSAIRLRKSRV